MGLRNENKGKKVNTLQSNGEQQQDCAAPLKKAVAGGRALWDNTMSALKKFGDNYRNGNVPIIPITVTALVILSIFIFYLIVTSDLSGVIKFFTAILVLLLTGSFIRALTNAEGMSGLIMIRLKEGIKFVEWMTQMVGRYWDVICDVGLVLSFGVVSRFAFKHLSLERIMWGLIALVAFNLLIVPYLPIMTMMLINIPPLATESAGAETYSLILAVLFFTGFVGYVLVSIFSSSIKVLAAVAHFFLGDTSILQTTTPGVSFVIPGITLPLLEGIIALIVLLVVHEGGHGVAARLAKVRIKSTGIITLGWLPMGAFVDVNEKQLEKANEKINAKVSVAGSTANLATCAIFFIPTLILLSAIPNYYADKLVVIGISEKLAMKGLENGMQILAVNGAEVHNITQFAQLTKNISANQTITILTNKGEFLVTTDSAGKIGIIVTQPIKDEYWYIKSLFSICGLITVLNFLVGVINLIPLPAFDGHRLFKIAIKNDAIVNAIVWLVIIAFLLNLLPWLWH